MSNEVERIRSQLLAIEPGQSVIYYVGDMASNKAQFGSVESASLAAELAAKGRVHLFQRRLGPPRDHTGNIHWGFGVGPGFEYIAVGRPIQNKGPTFSEHLRSVKEAV